MMGGDAENTPPPMPVNYFGMNGSGMYWNPATHGYVGLDPRMSMADQGALYKYQQMMDSLTGGTSTVKSGAMNEANRIKQQLQDPNTPAAMKTELQNRLNTINETMRTTGDWYNPLGKIGVTDPNRQLEFQKQTGTVADYLRRTLDTSMDQRALGENTALASRGLASSSNAQYGGQQRARDYGVVAAQNEVQANDYLRQLQAADEAKKYQMFNLAQSGAGSIEGKQLSQEQLALNQMMMGMNMGQGFENTMQNWNRQGAAIDAANKGMDAAAWRDAFGAVMGGASNAGSNDVGSADWWKKFGQGASGTSAGTSPNLWNMAKSQPSSGTTFNWGSPSSWGSQPASFTPGGWNLNQPGATPSVNWAYNTNTK
jgi:hypothetical protein